MGTKVHVPISCITFRSSRLPLPIGIATMSTMNETMRRNLLSFTAALQSACYDAPTYDLIMQTLGTFQETMRRGGSDTFTDTIADQLLTEGIKHRLVELSPCQFQRFINNHTSDGVYLFPNGWGVSVRYTSTNDQYLVNLIALQDKDGDHCSWEHADWPEEERYSDWENHWESPGLTESMLQVRPEWKAIVPVRCLPFLMEIIEAFNCHTDLLDTFSWHCLPQNAKQVGENACRFSGTDLGLTLTRDHNSVNCDAFLRVVRWNSEHDYDVLQEDYQPLANDLPDVCIKINTNLYHISPSTYALTRLFQHMDKLVSQ